MITRVYLLGPWQLHYSEMVNSETAKISDNTTHSYAVITVVVYYGNTMGPHRTWDSY